MIALGDCGRYRLRARYAWLGHCRCSSTAGEKGPTQNQSQGNWRTNARGERRLRAEGGHIRVAMQTSARARHCVFWIAQIPALRPYSEEPPMLWESMTDSEFLGTSAVGTNHLLAAGDRSGCAAGAPEADPFPLSVASVASPSNARFPTRRSKRGCTDELVEVSLGSAALSCIAASLARLLVRLFECRFRLSAHVVKLPHVGRRR
jgi:hypothetical protein